MEKNKALESLLKKANRIESKIQKVVKEGEMWRPATVRKYEALSAKKFALVAEFAAIGYKYDYLSNKVKEAV